MKNIDKRKIKNFKEKIINILVGLEAGLTTGLFFYLFSHPILTNAWLNTLLIILITLIFISIILFSVRIPYLKKN